MFDNSNSREIIRYEIAAFNCLKLKKRINNITGKYNLSVALKSTKPINDELPLHQLKAYHRLRLRYVELRKKYILKTTDEEIFVDTPDTISFISAHSCEINGALWLQWEAPDENGASIDTFQLYCKEWSLFEDPLSDKEMNHHRSNFIKYMKCNQIEKSDAFNDVETNYIQELQTSGRLHTTDTTSAYKLNDGTSKHLMKLHFNDCRINQTEHQHSTAAFNLNDRCAAYIYIRSHNKEGWSLWSSPQFIMFTTHNEGTLNEEENVCYKWGVGGLEAVQPINQCNEEKRTSKFIDCSCDVGSAAIYFDGSVVHSSVNEEGDVQPYIHEWIQRGGENVISIATEVGKGVAAAITCEGHLYVWGASNYGQCNEISSFVKIPKHICIPIPIIQVSFARECVMALTCKGSIYMWGVILQHPMNARQLLQRFSFDGDTQIRAPFLLNEFGGSKVIFIASKYYCFAAITEEGTLWTWGKDLYYQLNQRRRGDEEGRDLIIHPKKAAFFEKQKINFISFGAKHAAAIDIDGNVYTWGDSTKGQCGHGETHLLISPTPLNTSTQFIPPLDVNDKCTSVSCGEYHTVFEYYKEREDEHVYYACGSNRYASLGITSYPTKKAVYPHQIKLFKSKNKCISMKCGERENCIVL